MVFTEKVKDTIVSIKSQQAYNADIHTCFNKNIDDSIFLEVLLMKKAVFQFDIHLKWKRNQRRLKFP